MPRAVCARDRLDRVMSAGRGYDYLLKSVVREDRNMSRRELGN